MAAIAQEAFWRPGKRRWEHPESSRYYRLLPQDEWDTVCFQECTCIFIASKFSFVEFFFFFQIQNLKDKQSWAVLGNSALPLFSKFSRDWIHSVEVNRDVTIWCTEMLPTLWRWCLDSGLRKSIYLSLALTQGLVKTETTVTWARDPSPRVNFWVAVWPWISCFTSPMVSNFIWKVKWLDKFIAEFFGFQVQWLLSTSVLIWNLVQYKITAAVSVSCKSVTSTSKKSASIIAS